LCFFPCQRSAQASAPKPPAENDDEEDAELLASLAKIKQQQQRKRQSAAATDDDEFNQEFTDAFEPAPAAVVNDASSGGTVDAATAPSASSLTTASSESSASAAASTSASMSAASASAPVPVPAPAPERKRLKASSRQSEAETKRQLDEARKQRELEEAKRAELAAAAAEAAAAAAQAKAAAEAAKAVSSGAGGRSADKPLGKGVQASGALQSAAVSIQVFVFSSETIFFSPLFLRSSYSTMHCSQRSRRFSRPRTFSISTCIPTRPLPRRLPPLPTMGLRRLSSSSRSLSMQQHPLLPRRWSSPRSLPQVLLQMPRM
jgi:hypothetical protein